MGGVTYSPEDVAAHRAYLERLRNEYVALDGRMTALREFIKAAETYLQVLTNEAASPIPLERAQQPAMGDGATTVPTPARRSLSEWARILQDTTQMDALLRIAEANEGVVRVTEARNIIQAVKRTRGKPKNLSSHLYNLMNNSPKFEKIEPGVFRMVPGSGQVELPIEPETITPIHGYNGMA